MGQLLFIACMYYVELMGSKMKYEIHGADMSKDDRLRIAGIDCSWVRDLTFWTDSAYMNLCLGILRLYLVIIITGLVSHRDYITELFNQEWLYN